MIDELHSSPLTAWCMRSAKLTHEGKIIPEMESALYYGSLVHEALPLVHAMGTWNEFEYSGIVKQAADRVESKSKLQGRPISRAVEKNMRATHDEVSELLALYCQRFGSYFAECTLLGTEVPVRFALEVDGVVQQFASHLDLLFRDKESKLHCWDCKSDEKGPTYHYLSRNLQLGGYWLWIKEGSVMLNGEWVEMEEWPEMSWVQLNHLFPYKRATTWVDPETGEEIKYGKGDTRPTNKIVYPCGFLPECRDNIVEELMLRTRMNRLDLWPMNPDPVGCHVCHNKMFCASGTYNGKIT